MDYNSSSNINLHCLRVKSLHVSIIDKTRTKGETGYMEKTLSIIKKNRPLHTYLTFERTCMSIDHFSHLK